MRRTFFPVIAAWLLLEFPGAWAHNGGASFIEMQAQGDSWILQFDLPLPEIAAERLLDADSDGDLRWREVLAGVPAIRELLAQRLRVSRAGDPRQACRGTPVAMATLVRRDIGLHLRLLTRYACAGPLRLDARPWLQDLPEHGVYVSTGSHAEPVFVLTSESSQAVMGQSSAGRFVRLGVEHLLTGYDHLAFLGLLLLGVVQLHGSQGLSRRACLIEAGKIVTAFTLAHSVTLALAVGGVVNLPAGPVELAIAVSIVLTALAVLGRISIALGWPVALVFGLVHGLGFANLLSELLQGASLLLPLLSFNLGLELAQLLVVVLALPLLVWLAGRPRWSRVTVPLVSAGLAVLGSHWLIERL